MSEILHRLIQANMTPLPAWPSSMPLLMVASEPQFGDRMRVSLPSRLGNSYAGGLAEFEEMALKSLDFSVMPHRETEVAVAEAATFDWIFAKPQHRQRSWSDFHHWLVGKDLESPRLYWINGKAGSGKSTLMKHLVRHQKTRSALQAWAGPTKLLLSSFFFWHSGHELQKSQIGLFRALLYDCLKDHRELIPIALSGTENMDANDLVDYWTLAKLQEAFERLVSQTVFDIKFAFFIDGLDEYSGSHGEIAGILKQVSQRSNVKVCVSSRPLLVFERIFDSLPHLILQDLTYDDISLYVNNKLSDHERMRALEDYEPGLRTSLTSAIVGKASGVFLWVHLVVRSLLDGLGNYDVGDDLRRRLDDLPEELEALYWVMVQNVKPAWYLEEGFRLLRMVKASPSGVTLLRLLFAEASHNPTQPNQHIVQESWDKQDALCRDLAGRIKSHCLGLLETQPDLAPRNYPGPRDYPAPRNYPAYRNYSASRQVSFIHKSVFDFLDTDTAQSCILVCPGQAQFVPEMALLRGCLLEIKAIATWAPKGVPLKNWSYRVVPWLVDFMQLAQATENVLHDPSVALMGDFKKTVDDLWWESVVNKHDKTEDGTLAVDERDGWPNLTNFMFAISMERKISLPKAIRTFEELCLVFGLELYAAEMGFLPAGVAEGSKKARLSSASLEAAQVISTQDSTRHSKDPEWPDIRYS